MSSLNVSMSSWMARSASTWIKADMPILIQQGRLPSWPVPLVPAADLDLDPADPLPVVTDPSVGTAESRDTQLMCAANARESKRRTCPASRHPQNLPVPSKTCGHTMHRSLGTHPNIATSAMTDPTRETRPARASTTQRNAVYVRSQMGR